MPQGPLDPHETNNPTSAPQTPPAQPHESPLPTKTVPPASLFGMVKGSLGTGARASIGSALGNSFGFGSLKKNPEPESYPEPVIMEEVIIDSPPEKKDSAKEVLSKDPATPFQKNPPPIQPQVQTQPVPAVNPVVPPIAGQIPTPAKTASVETPLPKMALDATLGMGRILSDDILDKSTPEPPTKVVASPTPPPTPQPVTKTESATPSLNPEAGTDFTALQNAPDTNFASVAIPKEPQPTAPEAVVTPTTATPPTPTPQSPPLDPSLDVGLPKYNTPATPPPAESPASIKNDVAQILKEVKLPERRFDDKPEIKKMASVMPSIPADNEAALETVMKSVPAENGEEAAKQSEFYIPMKRTFKEDVTALMKTRSVSMVQELALQEKAREAKTTEVAEEARQVQVAVKKRSHGLLFAIITLFTLGALALGAVMYIALQRTPNQNTAGYSSLMFSEQSLAIHTTDTAPVVLRSQLGVAREKATLTLGAISQLVPLTADQGSESERPATLSEFLQALDVHPPDVLVRTFTGPFFLGIHTIDENVPVLVVPIQSYDRALAGMLEWEKTINMDLSPLFTAVPINIQTATGTPVANSFQDLVVNNFDTRVLRDAEGQIKMMYAFPTRNLLIIVEKPASFIEALSRLRAERRL